MLGVTLGTQRFEQLFSRPSSNLVDADRVSLSDYFQSIKIIEAQTGRKVLTARERANEYIRTASASKIRREKQH